MTLFERSVYRVFDFFCAPAPYIVRGSDHHYILRWTQREQHSEFRGFLASQLLLLLEQGNYYRYLHFLTRQQNTQPLGFVFTLPAMRTADGRADIVRRFQPELEAYTLGRGLDLDEVDLLEVLPRFVLAHLFHYARGLRYA